MTDERSTVPSRRRHRAFSVLTAGLVLLAFVPAISLAHAFPAAPRVGYAHPGANNTTVVVNLTDTPSYSPASITVPSNSTVFIHLHNGGNLTHTFTLVALNQSGVTLDRAWTPAHLAAYFLANGSQANVSLAPNATGWANLSYPASNLTRSFEFVSVVPYQFQAGMFGFLNVSSAGPAQLLNDNATNAFSFDPAILAATPTSPHAATTLHVKLTNTGTFPHTFTLAAQPNVTLSTIGYFNSKAPLVNVSIGASPGAVAWANFTVSAAGIYEFVCAVPGHFQSGMFGFLYVGVPVPLPPPAPSTAVVEVSVLIGAFTLLGIGVVLVVAAGFVGRFQRPPPSNDGHGPA